MQPSEATEVKKTPKEDSFNISVGITSLMVNAPRFDAALVEKQIELGLGRIDELNHILNESIIPLNEKLCGDDFIQLLNASRQIEASYAVIDRLELTMKEMKEKMDGLEKCISEEEQNRKTTKNIFRNLQKSIKSRIQPRIALKSALEYTIDFSTVIDS
ncbi:MAG: hypothetical protein EZS28_053351, partial [Streblomastix strix]